MSQEDLERLADEIAEYANECCSRSDGYKEDVRSIALKALEKVANLPDWISLKDQEPPERQPVLITDGEVVSVAYWDDRHKADNSPFWRPDEIGGYEWEWWVDDSKPTHWQPLPELPGKEKA